MEEQEIVRQEWMHKDILQDYVIRLKKKYRSQLSHIQPDNILYVAFSKKKSSKLAEIQPIKSFYSMLTNEAYALIVHHESWESLDEAQRHYIIYHQLLHIPEFGFSNGDPDYKKLSKPDLYDFKCLIDEFGVYKENLHRILDDISDVENVTVEDEDEDYEDIEDDEDDESYNVTKI